MSLQIKNKVIKAIELADELDYQPGSTLVIEIGEGHSPTVERIKDAPKVESKPYPTEEE